MDQEMIEKIFRAYAHLQSSRYLGCFCKDQMDKLHFELTTTVTKSLQHRHYALINSGNYVDNGEHWIGLVVDFSTHCAGYFDSFGRSFPWLNETLHKHFPFVKKSKYVLQSASTSTCGLHTIYFIINMMDPRNEQFKFYKYVDVGDYNRRHYETSDPNVALKDADIVDHLSKKFKTNFNILLKPFEK